MKLQSMLLTVSLILTPLAARAEETATPASTTSTAFAQPTGIGRPRLFFAGLGVVGGGVALAIAGAALYEAGADANAKYEATHHACNGDSAQMFACLAVAPYASLGDADGSFRTSFGVAMIAVGGAAIASGVTMSLIGAQPKRAPSPVPTIGIGPRAATARWTF